MLFSTYRFSLELFGRQEQFSGMVGLQCVFADYDVSQVPTLLEGPGWLTFKWARGLRDKNALAG